MPTMHPSSSSNAASPVPANASANNGSGGGVRFGYQSAESLVEDGIKQACQQLTMKLSDIHMASRRAAEAATRRADVAAWLNSMFNSLKLPDEPSEEDLRMCLNNGNVLCQVMNKLNPGSIPKIVSNPGVSNAEGIAHSAYQRFENVRNFLVAIDEMRLPTFEASDLEQGTMVTVVDCLLSLKEYYDGRHVSESQSSWKQGSEMGSPNDVKSFRGASPGASSFKIGSQSRKKWLFPEIDSSTSSENQGVDPKAVKTPHRSNDYKYTVDAESLLATPALSDSSTAWIQHIGQKFQEVLQVRARRYPDLKAVENSGMLNCLDNAPSQSLLSLVSAILGDKQNEEGSSDACLQLVEFMLRKVMEEFERRLLSQGQQLKKLKFALKEVLAREERISSRANVLEALAAGSGEEIKLMTDQLQKVQDEKLKVENEKQSKENEVWRLTEEKKEMWELIKSLQWEVENIRRTSQDKFQEVEKQKEEAEMKLQGKVIEMETLLANSEKTKEELKMLSAREKQIMKLKDSGYQTFLMSNLQQLKEVKAVSETAKQEVFNLQKVWEVEFQNLEKQFEGLANTATNYHNVLAENRRLYNEVQDLKGNIRVYCRVRPFLAGEPGKQTSIDYIGENGELMVLNPNKQGKDAQRMFIFNKVFGPSATQEDVFMDTQPLIRSVLDGYNVCIFAYGQTGSGKTHTMTGPNSATEKDWGVNYRALNDLFYISEKRKDLFKYEVGVQMIEIYNEQVRDLLTSDGSHKKLGIRSTTQPNGLTVPEASMLHVESTSGVIDLMKIGLKNRAVGATALNERSSRSHSVLTVHVQGTDLTSGDILRGCLHLVDLAGSERVDRSEVTGDRLREAQHINKSLSALGDVISALANKSSHVPYRNSKLTQILQDSLGGRAKTLMFVQLNPDIESYSESISTLKFAERVSGVELGAARSNKESKETRDLREQIASLKDVIAKKDFEIDRLLVLKESRVHVQDKIRTVSSPGQQKTITGVANSSESRPNEDLEFTSTAESHVLSAKCYSAPASRQRNNPRPSAIKSNERASLSQASNIKGYHELVFSGNDSHEAANPQVDNLENNDDVTWMNDGNRQVTDVDNQSDNSDRQSDSGSHGASAHFTDVSNYKGRRFSFGQIESAKNLYSSFDSAENLPSIDNFGERSEDREEKVSENSDGEHSTATETDVSLSSMVEAASLPKKEQDTTVSQSSKRRELPSRIPRPPLKSKYKSSEQTINRVTKYNGSGTTDESFQKRGSPYMASDSLQRKSPYQSSTSDSSQRPVPPRNIKVDQGQKQEANRILSKKKQEID